MRTRCIITVLQTVALASAARSAAASLRGDRGADDTGERRGKTEVGAKTTGRTVIVQIKKDKQPATKGRGEHALAKDCAAVAAAAGGTVAAVYDRVLHGCAVRLAAGRAGAAATAAARSAPRVIGLEDDEKVYASYSWGLDRVDQCALPLGGAGTLTKVDATGVRVYVVDTGIDKDHSEFAGMINAAAACHVNTVNDGAGPFDDGDGHG